VVQPETGSHDTGLDVLADPLVVLLVVVVVVVVVRAAGRRVER